MDSGEVMDTNDMADISEVVDAKEGELLCSWQREISRWCSVDRGLWESPN